MEYLKWSEWKTRRSNTPLAENKGQRPDYSFDDWLKRTKTVGDEVSSFIGQAKEKDQELDAELKKGKEKPVKRSDAEDEKSDDEEKAWKTILDIAKERREKDKKEKKSPSEK